METAHDKQDMVKTNSGYVQIIPTLDLPTEVVKVIQSAPTGAYQRALIAGRECWSGASLRGKARKYDAKYHKSAHSLLVRIDRTLSAIGWRAATALVLHPIRRRWVRELVIFPECQPEILHVW